MTTIYVPSYRKPPAKRGTRLLLAAGYLVCVAGAMIPPSTVGGVQKIASLLGFALAMGMSQATRLMATSEKKLDEMHIRLRDRYLARAYGILGILCIAGFEILDAVTDSSPFGIHLALTTATVISIIKAVIWPLGLLVIGLPALVACLSLPDREPAEQHKPFPLLTSEELSGRQP